MNDWAIIQNQATKSFMAETIWKSFIQERLYKITDVEENRIIVARISGGNAAHFTKGEALRAIESLKEKGRVKKSHLIHTVVRETMLVHLHPSICWDPKSKEIYWKENTTVEPIQITKEFIEDASDDELERIEAMITKRKNQSKFRKNILSIYSNKCVVTENGPEAVLQAAHIIKHSKSGINSNDNGLLLRSDIHNLFDMDLLIIHPVKLTVHLHPKLKTTYYAKYEGKKLTTGKGNVSPSKKYLKEKWDESKWSNLIK